MSTLTAHNLFLEDEAGNKTPVYIGTMFPASTDSVTEVLAQSDGDDNGRSGWMWVRLQDGTLILGVLPQGETYFATETDHEFPDGLPNTKDPTAFVGLIKSLASCMKDGEDDGEGGDFILENDDAVDTLHSFISEARALLDLPDRNDPPDDD